MHFAILVELPHRSCQTESLEGIRLREIPNHRNACRPKSVATIFLESGPMHRCMSQIVAAFDRPQTPNTPPPHRHTPSRQCRRRREACPSSGRPAARASRFTRSRASCTRSEKVVSATSWRGVKRSPYVRQPVELASEISAGSSDIATSGFHVRLRAAGQWLPSPASAADRPARAHPRRRWPSAARPCAQPCPQP